MSGPVYVLGDYARLLADKVLQVRNPPTAPSTFSAFETLFSRQFQLVRGRYFCQVSYCLQLACNNNTELLPVVHLALFVDGVIQPEGAEQVYQPFAAQPLANIHFAGSFQNAVSIGDGASTFEVRWRGIGSVPLTDVFCRPASFPSEEGVSICLLRIGQ